MKSTTKNNIEVSISNFDLMIDLSEAIWILQPVNLFFWTYIFVLLIINMFLKFCCQLGQVPLLRWGMDNTELLKGRLSFAAFVKSHVKIW